MSTLSPMKIIIKKSPSFVHFCGTAKLQVGKYNSFFLLTSTPPTDKQKNPKQNDDSCRVTNSQSQFKMLVNQFEQYAFNYLKNLVSFVCTVSILLHFNKFGFTYLMTCSLDLDEATQLVGTLPRSICICFVFARISLAASKLMVQVFPVNS